MAEELKQKTMCAQRISGRLWHFCHSRQLFFDGGCAATLSPTLPPQRVAILVISFT